MDNKKSIDHCFVDWESDIFGYGYGTGEEHTLRALKRFFDTLGKGKECPHLHSYDYEVMEIAMGHTSFWLMLNTLCHADIIEYGTSPRYGWLTEKGERLAGYLRDKTVDQLYSIVTEKPDDYISCTRRYCNCGPMSKDGPCEYNFFFRN